MRKPGMIWSRTPEDSGGSDFPSVRGEVLSVTAEKFFSALEKDLYLVRTGDAGYQSEAEGGVFQERLRVITAIHVIRDGPIDIHVRPQEHPFLLLGDGRIDPRSGLDWFFNYGRFDGPSFDGNFFEILPAVAGSAFDPKHFFIDYGDNLMIPDFSTAGTIGFYRIAGR